MILTTLIIVDGLACVWWISYPQLGSYTSCQWRYIFPATTVEKLSEPNSLCDGLWMLEFLGLIYDFSRANLSCTVAWINCCDESIVYLDCQG